ncbi:MAG: AAA family ATPase, partial [Desulfobacterales bacterium]|nr:AAA family ATPase [Desulfobacterales bacterium]
KPSGDKIQKKPRVDFSPALFLRERSDRGFEVMLKLMKEQILNNADIPEEFLNLCEGEITKTSKREDKEKPSLTDEIIYFPKHFNNEQLQIVEKLSSSTGVLVQGPPGTGKSHTIANLICHLLATGQRVLVTSKSPRALKVLNDQLPEKIRPLCISLLGNGIEEQKSLELSVNSILRNQDKWNQHDASLKVEELHKQLSELKSDKSEIENRLRSIREADSVEQSILGGIYQGTTAKIAKRVKNEEADYEWIKDKISYDQDLSIPSEEIIKLHKELIHFSPDLDAFLSQIVPDPEVDLPSPDILHKLLQKGKKTKKLYTDFETLLNSPIGQILEKTQPEFLQDLIEVSSKLIQAIEFSEKKTIPWIQDAIHDVYSDNDSPWSDLRRVFSSKLEGLKQRAEAIDTYSIQLPEHIDLLKILQNAKQLKEHFDKGGKLRWGPAKARVVRENNYIIKDIKVNGNSCKNTELLKILIEYLSVEQAIDYCWNLWQGKVERKAGRAFMQVSELEELHKALEDVININIIRKKACSLIDTIKGLHKPKLSDKEEIIDFFNTCNVASHKIELERIRNEWTENISKINSLVKKSKTHPIVKKALSALKSGNIEEYNNIFSEISRLKKESEKAVQVRTLLDKLAEFAPILAMELSDNPNNIDWPDRLKNIEKGWLWKRAKSYLEEYLNKDDIPGIQRRLGQLENDVKECLEELSSSLAWKFCFSRMGDAHRRSLVGWEQAIRKLGKGTGKHAPKHRRDAQHHLNQCKDAIPAWIMPLHRVYDS